jgi:hypothetical protein
MPTDGGRQKVWLPSPKQLAGILPERTFDVVLDADQTGLDRRSWRSENP